MPPGKLHFDIPFRNNIRNRQSSRAALAACALVVLVFFLNELRCVRYGCLTRTGFMSGSGPQWASPEAGLDDATGLEGQQLLHTTGLEGKELLYTTGDDAGPFGVGPKEVEADKHIGIEKVEGSGVVEGPTLVPVVEVQSGTVYGGRKGRPAVDAGVQGSEVDADADAIKESKSNEEQKEAMAMVTGAPMRQGSLGTKYPADM